MSVIVALLASGLTPLSDPSGWISTDDYPAEAVDAGEAGAVLVSLTVANDGSPVTCAISESSSSDTLDSATCSLLMQRARFSRSDDGEPRIYRQRVVWAIPEAFAASEGSMLANLSLDGTGGVLACEKQVVGGEVFPDDPCDFGPQTLGLLFGDALQGALGAHYRLAILPRDENAISIDAKPRAVSHRVLMELHFDMTPAGVGVNCQAVQLDELFGSENPCDWMSSDRPEFAPDSTRTTNRPMKIILDSWIDPR